MAILFAVFTNYRRLIRAHYLISYEEYGFSVIKALILAKVILVAEKLCLGRGLEDKPSGLRIRDAYLGSAWSGA
jgi:hypothetical protein